MTEKVYDPYDFETGLKEEFVMTVDQARFSYDSAYNEGQTVVMILEGTDDDGDEQRLLHPVGPGWEAVDAGKRLAREDGADSRRLNQRSGVAVLVKAAIDCGAPLRKRGTPMEASIWPGLRFRWRRTKLNEGTSFETTRPLPVEFLGTSANGTVGAVGATTTTAPAGTGSPAGSKIGMAKLKSAAKRAADFDSFIEEGLAIADGNAELERLVADEAWFNEVRRS
jgi:hypothetical protein